MNYKIGDKVRVRTDLIPGKKYGNVITACNWKVKMAGEVGEIQVIDKDDNTAKAFGYWWHESMLEPYVEPPKFKFNVGDKVRAIAENHAWGYVKKGDIGMIINEPDSKGDYRADFPKQKHWYGAEHCFELVVDEPPEVKPAPVEDKPFKVGDRVKVNHQDGTVVMTGIIRDMSRDILGIEYSEELNISSDMWDSKFPDKAGYGWYELKKWVEFATPINQAPEDKTIHTGPTFEFKGNKTTCIIDVDGRKFKGVTHCDPGDEWNEDRAKAWAELRAIRKVLDAAEKNLRG